MCLCLWERVCVCAVVESPERRRSEGGTEREGVRGWPDKRHRQPNKDQINSFKMTY